MSFTLEVIEQVKRYQQAIGNDIKRIDTLPWHEIVQLWWESKAYFKESGYYTKLENVPETEDRASIVNKKGLHRYVREKGVWRLEQSVSKELYKG